MAENEMKNLFSFDEAVKNARVVSESPTSDDPEISADDFKLVQMDTSIHDVKFGTKPTTFFKDAMRRFVKNKSSVVAFIILTILILMAIFVPIFNTNSIDENFPNQTFLPPKWHGFENSGVMDGRKEYGDILVAKPDEDDQSTWYPVGYEAGAVVEGSQIYVDDVISGTASPYAVGGSAVLRTDTRDKTGGLVSPLFQISLDGTSNYAISFYLPEDKNTYTVDNAGNQVEIENIASYRIFADVLYDDVNFTHVLLTDYSSNFGEKNISNINNILKAAIPDDVDDTTFRGRFGIELQTSESGIYPALYVDEFIIEDQLNPNEETLAAISWDDANALLLRQPSSTLPTNWTIYGSGSRALDKAAVTRVTFDYDEYEAAFGEELHFTIGGTIINEYIANGWVEYDFNEGPSSFRLTELGEEESPLRSVDEGSQRVLTGPGGVKVYEVKGTVIMYRYWGYDEVPYYAFGTNHNGRDQFKVVFAGLRTSLILGLISTIICVGIGIVWGAISGYYGGTIDLVMERITDVLSGIPYIVVMTLAILLLGNNFGVFLLSLVATGWIGTSSRTRAQFYRYKGREFVLASRTLGAKDSRLIFKHILPNAMGPIITGSVLMIPSVVFTEANISYLGLGLQGMPSLGVALSEAQQYLKTSPYLIVSAAIVVSILMICFNLFGNGLRDAFNPSLKGVSE